MSDPPSWRGYLRRLWHRMRDTGAAPPADKAPGGGSAGGSPAPPAAGGPSGRPAVAPAQTDTAVRPAPAAPPPRAPYARRRDDPAPQLPPPAPHEPPAAAPPSSARRDAPRPRPVTLALQGGGSHGAFTWGVLDRLLEDPSLEFTAASGTSAGAMNAAVLATGLARGGRSAAREALREFWLDIAKAGAAMAPLAPRAGTGARPGSLAFALPALPGYQWLNSVLRTLSPYDFNPLNLNPLRDVAVRHIDEDALRDGPIRVFITATAVHSGQARVFSGADLSLDAMLASACLPFLFKAVEIDGEPYWDGGYSGNPALYPLIQDAPDADMVLVRINPLRHSGTPRRSSEIMDRVSEITFNAGLLGELKSIAFVAQCLRAKGLDAEGVLPRLHMVADDVGLAPFQASTKLVTDREFLERLHGLGRKAAGRFLSRHGDQIGQQSSLDIETDLLGMRRGAGRAAAASQKASRRA